LNKKLRQFLIQESEESDQIDRLSSHLGVGFPRFPSFFTIVVELRIIVLWFVRD